VYNFLGSFIELQQKMLKKFVFILTLFFIPANALKIEINRGHIQPDPIAIVDFYDINGEDSEIGHNICDIIRNDLKLSGLFLPLDSDSFLESKQTLCRNGPNIKNWKVLGTRFLVYGKITSKIGSFRVEFELTDVVTNQKMLSLKLEGALSKSREISHMIADYIYERITNESGYFNTKVVYVETAYGKNSQKRKTRLIKIDQDGFNPTPLTDGLELVLTPRYSSNGKNIVYISYSDKAKGALGKSAHIYMINERGARTLVISEELMRLLVKKNHGNPVRMTYAPRFSPNGEEIVLAVIIDGKSAIYKINLATNQLIQLTEHSCIDTSPCFSNDGEKIVFTSNRQGREAIYVMNKDGTDQRRISIGEGKYSQPIWSPRGDLIAFSKQTGGQFFIGTMNPDGSGERLITSGYLVEAPCWASNGRYLAYSMESGPCRKPQIGVVDITGHHIRIIDTQKDASHPAWSPTIKTNH
jgi:TolB protein